MEADRDKLQTFYLHVLRASQKFREKQVHRSKLIKTLQDLRKMNVGGAFKEKLDELEVNVSDLVNKEKRIIKAQNEEHLVQSSLHRKIGALDSKLKAYMTQSQKRDSRIGEIEKKIEHRMQKRDKMAELQGQLEGLEVMYFKLKRRNISSELFYFCLND